MNKVMTIKVVTLNPHPEYEGKWVAELITEESPTPRNYWISHKQMGSIQKNMDKALLFAAFDCSKKFPRMIWASTNKQWLQDTFCKDSIQEAIDAPKTFEEIQSGVRAVKQAIADYKPTQSLISEEELPF
jgi:hypothetical protein